MSTTSANGANDTAMNSGRPNRLEQVAAVAWTELSRWRFGLHQWPAIGLAVTPLAIMFLALSARRAVGQPVLSEDQRVFAEVFANFGLPVALFFAALALFMNLFRGELLDGSLHFYFLSPIRRELVVVGKYLAGIAFAVPLFIAATVAAALTPYLASGGGLRIDQIAHGPGLGQLMAYGAIAALAAVGYGALFLAVGLFFKNPILPGIMLLGWESSNFLLPAPLKQLSVMYYLKSLMPITISDGPFAIVSEPASPAVVLLGVAAVSAAALALAVMRARRMEVYPGPE